MWEKWVLEWPSEEGKYSFYISSADIAEINTKIRLPGVCSANTSQLYSHVTTPQLYTQKWF